MSNILITGYKGDVGSTLYGLYKNSNINICPLDLSVNNVSADRILHLAARSPLALPDEIIQSNILFLQDIIKYAYNNKIKEIIFFSSSSVYGNPDREYLEEHDQIANPDIYGITKLLGEKLLEYSPINVLCLRFPAILSLKNTNNFMSRCYLKLKNDNPIEIINPDKIFNNFISIENIFNFLLQVKVNKKFDVINLASKREKTLFEIVSMIKNISESKSEITISDKICNFFNISTVKAERDYNFIPYRAEDTIKKWIEQKTSLSF
jgi:nucleoside-diphosphate-sugar epimerase